MQFKQENEKIENEITLIKNERVLIQQQLKKLKEKYDKKEKELRDLYNEKLKKIEELEHKKVYKVKISFLNGDNDIITIKYNDLNEFYTRVKEYPKLFIKEVSNAISIELYEFDKNKIDKMAKEIALRMKSKDADLLIESIKSKY